MEKAEYVDRVAIREKVCTGCTMLVDGVCCDADPCENLIAGFLEEPPADVVPAHRKENAHSVPLTLDELRKMDGEPVYCVEITGREEWLFRRYGGFADMYGEFTSDDFMSWDNYGKLWWCYRQKPEEESHQ